MKTTRPRDLRSNRLHRSAHHNAGIVDDGVQGLGQGLAERGDAAGIGDVEDHRGDLLRVQRDDGSRVAFVADTGDHVPATCGQVLDDRLADSTACAGDEH